MPGSFQAPKRALAAALTGGVFLLLPLAFGTGGAPDSRWVSFLGAFHPLLLHLPIGVVMAIGGFEAWSLFRRQGDPRLRVFLWLLAAGCASASFGSGYLLGTTGGHDEMLLEQHLWFAGAFTATCWFALGLLLVRDSSWARLTAVVVVAVPMFGAGHFGGLMVHGNPFANAPWRPDPTARQILPPLGESIAVYADIVQPVLTAKCQRCHGPGKKNGRLRVDSFEHLLAGGAHGATVVAGRAADSRMIQAIELPLEDDEHMPPKGKPQLTEPEIALLKWWIDRGATAQTVVARSDAPPVVAPFLVSNYRLLPDPELVAQQQAEEQRYQAEEAQRRKELEVLLAGAPDELRPLFFFSDQASSALNLVVSTSPREFRDEQLQALAPLLKVCTNINLSGTTITDDGLIGVEFSPRLRQLNLKDTGIGVAALTSLATATGLQALNLFGTPVDDRLADAPLPWPSLRRLFLGNTGLSAGLFATLQQQHPECEIIANLSLPLLAGEPTAATQQEEETEPNP